MSLFSAVARQVKGRLLVSITLFYLAGILAGRFFAEQLLLGAAALTLLLVFLPVLLFYLRLIDPYRLGLLILIFFCGVVAFHYSYQQPAGGILNYAGSPLYMEGTVVDEPLFYDDHDSYELRVDTVETGEGRVPVRGTLLVKIYGESEDKYWFGEKLRIRAAVVEPRGLRNPGGFDYRFYLRTRGVDALAYPRPEQVFSLGSGDVNPLLSSSVNLRAKMADFVHNTLPAPSSELLTAILFGQRSRLPEEVEHNFRRAGAGHLMAVSGLHVGLVAALVAGAWKILGLRGPFPVVTAVALVLAYAYLTGMRPSALRAALMVSMSLGAVLLERDRDLPTAVSFAALVTLFINPLLLFTAGFQLSYAVTLVLVYAYRPLYRMLASTGCPQLLSAPLAVVIAAQVGVLPLSVYYFQHMPTGAVFFNLLLMPLMAFVVAFGLLGSLVGLVVYLPGEIILWAARPLLEAMLIVTSLSSLPGFYISLQPPGLFALCSYYGLLVVLLFVYYRYEKFELNYPGHGFTSYVRDNLSLVFAPDIKRRAYYAGAVFLLAGILAWFVIFVPGQEKLKVTFIDVGQGASALVETPCGVVIMIDAGGDLPFQGDPGDVGERILLPFLRYEGIREIDLAVVTHPHEDHFGGFLPLVNEIAIDRMLVSPVEGGSTHYTKLLDKSEMAGIEIIQAGLGQVFSCGPDFLMECYFPPARLLQGTGCDLNNNSLVFMMHYGHIRILFTGDIEDEAVNWLLESSLNLGADVLQVPHHGGYLEAMPQFLDRVNPDLALIQVGANPFGHPHSYVIEALDEAGVATYRNDYHGAVVLKSDGKSIEVFTTTQPAAADLVIVNENNINILGSFSKTMIHR